PGIGLNPYSFMLFNPWSQEPLRSAIPSQDGTFQFAALPAGDYILSAELEGYYCAQPRWVSLTENLSADTLRLAVPLPVSGNLSNAIWESGKVYRLAGDIIVLPDAALTVQAGATVIVDGDYELTAFGGIQVLGSPMNPVRFLQSAASYASGGNWDGIRVDHLNYSDRICSFSGVMIQGAFTALHVIGGTVQINECLFLAPLAFGLYLTAVEEGTVEHSLLLDSDQGIVADNCSAEFSYNLLLRLSGMGITIKNDAHPLIQYNALLECETGIWSNWGTAPTIQYNLFNSGSHAVDAQNGFTASIRYNDFIGQTAECLYFHFSNCYPLIENNNFIDMPSVILHVSGFNGQQADTIFAPNNYWDGEDAEGIAQKIVDGKDSSTPSNPIGPVIYEPFYMSMADGTGP
ncbi:MAG: NosD domain-containing protein, partial [bacterium]